MKPRRALVAALLLCAGAFAAPPHHSSPQASAESEAQIRYEAARAADALAKAQAAAGKADAEGRLQDLRGQLDALAQQQQEAADQRSDASKALRAADTGLGAAARALHDTDSAIAVQQAKLTTLEAQQVVLTKQLAAQRAQLAVLVRSAYALGGDEQLKLLLAQDRVVDLARALQYHRYFQAARLRRIHDLTAQLQTLADVSKQVDAQRAALAASRQEQSAKLAAVQAQRAQRGRVLATLNAGYRDRAARMQTLGRDSQALDRLVGQLDAVMKHAPPPPPPPPPPPRIVQPPHPTQHVATVTPTHAPETPELATPAHPTAIVRPTVIEPPAVEPFTGAPGHFAWPIAGHVLAGFGGDSNGLLIAGTAGEEVHAVADGRVAFANWLKGYGLLLIVDHGHGVMSLYANNDALLKNTGDVVRTGDALATVGSSGDQGRNALYFEIRLNGKAVDPRGWLRPR
ncbi:MAG: peptidoglycan DD-metalloendopeptidase family protein [Proteobacteria bacterium]|nr:peptidoglycan DD-metalloendopeptidase family protein [Pseudomonadota bacterium]